MTSSIRKLNLIVCLVVPLSLLAILLVPGPVEPSRLYLKGEQDDYLSTENLDGVPESVILDARHQADNLYGSNIKAVEDLTAQLIGTFAAARNIDVLIIFNAGGFGWSSVKDSPGWRTLMEGIMQELSDLNHEVLALDHKRTQPGLTGVVNEVIAFWGLNPLKSRELALRIEFLTRHLPGIQVIVAGESNGSGIVEETIRKLKDNHRVFAIQTGPMVVQRRIDFERSLVTRHNGKRPDSLSNGDFFTIIRANLEDLMGIEQECMGEALFYIGAPGHHYPWEHEALREKISSFLYRHFA